MDAATNLCKSKLVRFKPDWGVIFEPYGDVGFISLIEMVNGSPLDNKIKKKIPMLKRKRANEGLLIKNK